MVQKADSEIEQWVLRALWSSEKICSREVCVFARDGVVRLRGSAQSHQDKLAIEEAARSATGVVGVMNEIRVKPCTALGERLSTAASLLATKRSVSLLRLTIQRTAVKAIPRSESQRVSAGSKYH